MIHEGDVEFWSNSADLNAAKVVSQQDYDLAAARVKQAEAALARQSTSVRAGLPLWRVRSTTAMR